MLPYLAQGANSAIEDGAVLGLLLGHLETKDQLPQALKMYERLRKSRGDAIARETFKQVSSHRVPFGLSGKVLTLFARRGSLSTCMTVLNSLLETRYSHRSSAHRRSMSHSRVDGLARKSSHGSMDMMLSLWWNKQFKRSPL
jgi:2-polyprenyl-6-methoxyphenol hydroxylase-like FAD-dependent oxidoreductase